MFGRKKTLQDDLQQQASDARPGAKNRPTPKRRDQEALNRRPLVVTDRKRARSVDREKRREAYAKQRQAMVTGDDAHLPPRDKGPERRYIRDYVDARWSVGEILLPVMLLVLLLSLVPAVAARLTTFVLVYGLLAVAVVDSVVMWRRVKKKLVAKFGADKVPTGAAMYTVMRSFQLRPTRMPKPQVKRGQFPS
ncbi:DUF3043 domain-containing protein [Lapillicoccus jejuensis]|uniref:DUF3043 family protein n=1 Tax=Lapillicoccus jejuensis TaxID=402171 RepID=A0A542E5R1_9MICO|nr:DUF3043 domain-containing protein [Lapillicoccus jejuensis]TQJ10673.1 DUF3043 family protein [Lapillicoccus jejuensis]